MAMAIWNFKNNAREKPQSSVIVTIAIFVFLILILMVMKIYNDYQLYISITQYSADIGFALITDLFILAIGMCLLYLNNFLFLNSVNEETSVKNMYIFQKEFLRKKIKGDKKSSNTSKKENK